MAAGAALALGACGSGEDSTPAGASCPRYAALLVTPPNSTLTSRVTRALSICDPQIHPVVPGTAGSQH